MRKPNNWENTATFGEYEKLELGGHICVVVKVEETKSKSGKDMLNIYLDIAEGSQKGFYSNLFENDTRNNKKWPCIVYQVIEDIDGNANKGYKTFIEAVKKSNQGFREDALWEPSGCDLLKGKLVGGVFGREQYKNSNGELKWSTKCVQFRDVETIRKGVEVPEDKYLEGQGPTKKLDNFQEIPQDEDDLPF